MAVDFTHRQQVQVRDPNNMRWTDATIHKLEGKGAVVAMKNGRRQFYFFQAIRPANPKKPSSRPPSSPDAKLGDLKSLKELAVDIAMTGYDKEAAAAPAPPPVEPPWTPPPDIPLTGVKKSKPRHISTPRPRGSPRTPTKIGDAMRAIRMERGIIQSVVADAMPIARNRMIRIECGDTLPDELEVSRFCKAIGVPETELQELRAQSVAERRQKPVVRPLGAAPEELSSDPTESKPVNIRIKYDGLETEGLLVAEWMELYNFIKANKNA